MALEILTEQRDFIGEGAGQSCGRGTAQGDSTEISVFSVTLCNSADTA
jgi:hypothetical protein